MFQRVPIGFPQLETGNTSKNLLDEIIQIAYFWYQSKEITKKVYNNTIKSIQT